jgi:spore coat protein U-like protein
MRRPAPARRRAIETGEDVKEALAVATRRIGAAPLLAALVALAALPIRAENRFTTLVLRSAVASNCRIAVSDLSFGAYDPIVTHAGSNLDAAALLTVTCTKGIAVNVLMDDGSHEVAGVRRMVSGAQNISYALYRDASRSRQWERGNVVAARAEGVFTPTTLGVYGRIPAGQVVPAGAYSDTVTATVDF